MMVARLRKLLDRVIVNNQGKVHLSRYIPKSGGVRVACATEDFGYGPETFLIVEPLPDSEEGRTLDPYGKLKLKPSELRHIGLSPGRYDKVNTVDAQDRLEIWNIGSYREYATKTFQGAADAYRKTREQIQV